VGQERPCKRYGTGSVELEKYCVFMSRESLRAFDEEHWAREKEV
jgi:hypothetical protein